jgi:hypothetical protein
MVICKQLDEARGVRCDHQRQQELGAKAMIITDVHITISLLVAVVTSLGIAVAVYKTSPNLAAASNRLRRMLKVVGTTAAYVCAALGAIMLIWGIKTGSADLMYFSMAPIVFSIMISNWMSRNGIR